MNATQLMESGTLAAFIAAGCLASVPTFEPTRRGWLPRFGWILLRYVLPLVALVAVVSWCLLWR